MYICNRNVFIFDQTWTKPGVWAQETVSKVHASLRATWVQDFLGIPIHQVGGGPDVKWTHNYMVPVAAAEYQRFWVAKDTCCTKIKRAWVASNSSRSPVALVTLICSRLGIPCMFDEGRKWTRFKEILGPQSHALWSPKRSSANN